MNNELNEEIRKRPVAVHGPASVRRRKLEQYYQFLRLLVGLGVLSKYVVPRLNRTIKFNHLAKESLLRCICYGHREYLKKGEARHLRKRVQKFKTLAGYSHFWFYFTFSYIFFLVFINDSSFFACNDSLLIFIIFLTFAFSAYIDLSSRRFGQKEMSKNSFLNIFYKLKKLNVQSLKFFQYFFVYNNLILLKNLLIFLRSFFLLVSFDNLLFFESNLSIDFSFYWLSNNYFIYKVAIVKWLRRTAHNG